MEHYVTFDLLGYTWTVRSEFAPLLKEEVIPLVLQDEDSPHRRVVRRKLTRDSFFVSVPGSSEEIFAKVHKYSRRKDRLKTIIRASRARAEWEMSRKMLERGFPVAESLALGERRSCGLVSGCVLLQRAIPNCLDLSGYIRKERSGASISLETGQSPDSGRSQEDHVLKSLGGLVRQMHAAGFYHPDLHPGNILVEKDGVSPQLWIVDLHAAGSRSRVSRRRRMADLAKIVFSLRDLIEESQLREIIHAYRPEAGQKEIRSILTRLEKACASLYRMHIRSRSKRCLKTSGGFVVEKIGNMKLYRRRSVESNVVLEAVRRHNEISSSKGPELIKATPKRFLTSFRLGSESGDKVYVKEFLNHGFVKLLEAIFYVHKGRRAWKVGHRLKVLKIPCAELMALAEKREFGVLSTSYLIMKEVPDAVQLDTLLIRRYFRIDGRLRKEEILEKRRLTRAGARAVGEIHKKKIYHKDLSAKNLLVETKADDGISFCFVDVDSIQFPLRLSMRRRIKNLSQLNGMPGCITATDKLRFYMGYHGIETLTPKHKFIISIICRISRRRLESLHHADQRIREQLARGIESYEDPASL